MSPDPEARLETLRKIALAFPAACEKLSHGRPGFFVEGGKFFAYFTHNHHGDARTAVLVRTSGREEQAMLIEMNPDQYFLPPYMGPSGWIGFRLDQGTPDWEHVTDWLRKSWAYAAPAKLRRAVSP